MTYLWYTCNIHSITKAIPKQNTFLRMHLDLTFSILPLFYVSKAVGLTCFTLKRDKDKLSFKYSSYGAIYNILVTFSLVVLAIVANIDNHLMNYPNKSILTIIIDKFELNSTLLFSVVTLVILNINQKKIIECIQQLQLVDLALESCDVELPHVRNRKRTQGQLFCESLHMVINCLFSSIILSSSIYFPPSCVFAYSVPRNIVRIAEYQLVAWLFALKQRFSLLNKCLSRSGPHNLALFKTLSGVHFNLCRLSATVNNIFSVVLLLGFTSSFFDLIGCVYYLKFLVVEAEQYKENIYLLLIFNVYLCCWHCVKLFLICYFCSATTGESRKSGTLLHNTARKTKDPLTRKYLKRFSYQSLHQRVLFTACGIFPVNFSLIYSIIGAITTYLVILIQFETNL